MSGRFATILTWGLWLLDMSGIVVSLLLAVTASGVGRLADLVTEAAFIGFATVGALIVAQRLRNRVGWLLCAIGTGTAFTSFSYGYLVYADARGYTQDPFTVVIGLLGNVVWPLNLGLGMLLLLLFPTGRLPSPRWRVIAGGVIVLSVLEALSAVMTPGPVDPDMKVNNPLGVPVGADALSVVGGVGGVLVVFVALATVASVILRYMRARGIERQQLKWFAYSCALMVMIAGGASVVGVLLHDDNVPNLGFSAGFLFLPLGLGVAILRHRLYDIDVIINRTLVYASLTAVLAGVYLAGVVSVQGLTQLVRGGAQARNRLSSSW